MKRLITFLLVCVPFIASAQLETHTYETSAGNVDITLIGHSSLMIGFKGKIIHIDPYSKVYDYSQLPKADLVLITHEHGDHFDKNALEAISKRETEAISNKAVADQYDKVDLYMENDEVYGWEDVQIDAVPAYNLVHRKDNGEAYHPKGVGNGYVLTFGNFRVYIAGDTEPIPEMNDLEDINVAFLPKNLPYTMSDEEFVVAARMVKPEILYPYHYSRIDWDMLRKQLEGIEIK